MTNEATARIKINKLLEEAGWRFFDDKNGKANIVLEKYTKITQHILDEFGNDFEKTKRGFIDFLLLDGKGIPLIVLEAKKEALDPLVGKEQARKYANSQKVRFIILSNGNLHYWWDLEQGNPEIITTFPTDESTTHQQSFKPNPASLATEKVTYDYVALTQNLNYAQDPAWIVETTRAAFIEDQKLKFLRPYQLQAIQALQTAAIKKKTRYLFEMATGTGKTLVSAAIIKLFLKTGNATRVLFLVDRIELEDQACKQFKCYLKNDFSCAIYKENRNDWRKAEIVVSTAQSLVFNNKYQKIFSPTDFNLLISDEAHRSINGNHRAVFEYFLGYKLGLTATPKNYLKNLNAADLSENDSRAWEQRQLRDTYCTFGCESGEPTFRYSLLDGVKDGFLVNPIVVDARTEITAKLLSEGYVMKIARNEDADEEQTFFHKDFERKFFSEHTNRVLCKTFLANALRDPLSGEIGKSIVFCVSQKHATKITQILNELADEYWPGKYQSDFAVQITSNIIDAQQYTSNFANNNLNGETQWLADYTSSKTRVCVTVKMMMTGYDCEDILNLCLIRPIFSPTDFIQMKGRGTRKYTFKYCDPDNQIITAEKQTFKLFDFFANCEYFEEKYNYDEILKLPTTSNISPLDEWEGNHIRESQVNSYTPDAIKSFSEMPIGLDGMKIDWKFYETFESTVKNDPVAKEKYDQGDILGVEAYIQNKIFNNPKSDFDMKKLRKALKADRCITLREMVEKIFGGITQFKMKDELLEDEVEKFIAIYKPASNDIVPLRNLLKAYIADAEIREIMKKQEYSRLAANSQLTLNDFKALNKKWLSIIPQYVKDYVSLSAFT